VVRTLSFIPSPADVWLEIGEVPRASPLILTGPAPLDHESYTAQIWRKPTSVHAAGAQPLATAYGSGSSGVASVIFSASQLSIELLADSGYYDDLWLTVNAVQSVDSQPAALRWGWLRLVEAGFNPLADSFSAELTFVVVDDVAYITYAGVVYTLPVALIGSSSVDDGVITVSEDTLYFSYGGQRWGAPSVQATPLPGATDGEGVVLDDVLYVTLAGISHTAPVVVGEMPPEVPGPGGESTSVLVTGSDGAEYIQTTFSDGTVRFSPTYEVLP
jgi:hypothetical protein